MKGSFVGQLDNVWVYGVPSEYMEKYRCVSNCMVDWWDGHKCHTGSIMNTHHKNFFCIQSVWHPSDLLYFMEPKGIPVLNDISLFRMKTQTKSNVHHAILKALLMESNHGSWIEIEARLQNQQRTRKKCHFGEMCSAAVFEQGPNSITENNMFTQDAKYVLWFELKTNKSLTFEVNYMTKLQAFEINTGKAVDLMVSTPMKNRNASFIPRNTVSHVAWKGNVTVKKGSPTCLSIPGVPFSVEITGAEGVWMK